MATATLHKSAPQRVTGAHDRVFYSGMAILLALAVFVGFAPTYYLRGLLGAPPTVTGATSLSGLAHLHGALFTGWVVLFIVQTALIARHRVIVHRRFGVAGAFLAAVMVPVGTIIAVKSAARGAAPPGTDPLSFLAIPIFDMVFFAAFVTVAVWLRRHKEAHKRLMLLAYMSIAAAGVARWPGVLPLGPFGFYGFTFIFLVAAIAYDFASRRRIHPAYIWGGGLLVASVPLRLMLSGTAAWRSFAEFLVATFT